MSVEIHAIAQWPIIPDLNPEFRTFRGIAAFKEGKSGMNMSTQVNLLIMDKDARKLRSLIESSYGLSGGDDAQWQSLEEEIDRAEIVSPRQMPPNVVTMHSRVRIVDMRTGEQLVYQIVYPYEANYAEKRISVLAPIGMALLGYPAGTEIEWRVPSGSRRLRIEAVEQPSSIKEKEAA